MKALIVLLQNCVDNKGDCNRQIELEHKIYQFWSTNTLQMVF